MQCSYCGLALSVYRPKLYLMAIVVNIRIIAVNYEARDFGVTRSMRGDEARKKCPDIELVHVPSLRGKADLTKYRDAGREVVDVFCQFSDCVQRASVDEAYIDITQAVDKRMKSFSQIKPSQLATTYVVGFCETSNDEDKRLEGLTAWLNSMFELQDDTQIRLAVAALIVEEMRAAVFKQTDFRCSAGISHNKILGKLACGLHKPNRQTVLPQAGVPGLFKTLPIKKVRNLGGKFGCIVEEQLGCSVMADLLHFSEHQLQQRFDDKTGTWLYNIARGIDNEAVTPRLVSKSIGCCKKFPGRQALATRADVEYWLRELAAEVAERLEKDLDENKRRAKLLCVSFVQDSSCSRSGPLSSYDSQRIANDAFDLLKKSNSSGNQDTWYPPLKYLGLSVGKFVDEGCNQNSTLLNFFKAAQRIPMLSQKRQEKAAGNAVLPDTSSNSDDDMFENNDKTNCEGNDMYLNSNLEDKIISNSKIRTNIVRANKSNSESDNMNIKYEASTSHVNKTNSKSENMTGVNFGASTSRIDDDTDELCVSLSEIFPDLDEIDNDVVSLLPSPMQKRLQTRIEYQQKQNTNIALRNEDISMKNNTIINYEKRSNQQSGLEDQQIEFNNQKKQNTLKHRNGEKETNCDSQCKADSSKGNINCELVEKCPECGKEFPLSEYLEHLDFHAAEKLHKELNRVPQLAPLHTTAPVKVPAKRKRGRPGKKKLVIGTDKKLRSITAYFSPQCQKNFQLVRILSIEQLYCYSVKYGTLRRRSVNEIHRRMKAVYGDCVDFIMLSSSGARVVGRP
ncbi:hypothetical protein L9F63_008005, partial [Diploptera punctata]